jgi:hypothetical protein
MMSSRLRTAEDPSRSNQHNGPHTGATPYYYLLTEEKKMGDIISITLDPTKDGIVGKVDTMVATSGKYVVIGTNAEHRFISEKQFDAYTDELGKDDVHGDRHQCQAAM